MKLGALDATAHQGKASEYGVRGYPTIKFFSAGSKSRGSADEYDGGRTADDIVRWAEEKAVASLPPPEIKQVRGRVGRVRVVARRTCFKVNLGHVEVKLGHVEVNGICLRSNGSVSKLNRYVPRADGCLEGGRHGAVEAWAMLRVYVLCRLWRMSRERTLH